MVQKMYKEPYRNGCGAVHYGSKVSRFVGREAFKVQFKEMSNLET